MGLEAELEQRCDAIAEHLRARKLATEEEIKACYEQSSEGELRWALAYGDLRSLHADRQSDTLVRRANDEQEVLAALADEPDTVLTESGKGITVYPKAFSALQLIAHIGERIDFLLRRSQQLVTAGLALNDELFFRVDREVVFLYHALVTGVTHRGPQLPFDDLRKIAKFPGWVLDLSPVEIQRIHFAFVRVNAIRLAVISRLMKMEAGKEQGPGSTWATFFSLRSDESHIPSPVLMRDHSLASQMAAALIAAKARLDASKKAA